MPTELRGVVLTPEDTKGLEYQSVCVLDPGLLLSGLRPENLSYGTDAELDSRRAGRPSTICVTPGPLWGDPNDASGHVAQVMLELAPAGERDVGWQVWQAFYGEEAQRIQRGPRRHQGHGPLTRRRPPVAPRIRKHAHQDPGRQRGPFGYVAAVESGRGFSTIRRVNRSRAISVTASLDETVTSAGAVSAALAADVMPAVARDHADVRYLDLFIEDRGLGTLFTAACDVLLSDNEIVQPDLLFVSRERKHLLSGGQNVQGVRDLVIEILSPPTGDKDRGASARSTASTA